MRSMSMANIVRLYRELMPVAKQKGFQVVDITHYYDYEARELMNRYPSDLKLAAHTLRNFVDTTQYLGLNTLVASIDTSLIHLACWCGYRPTMLAHRWPDGRWLQGSWQNIEILEQETLFDWEPPIQRLIQRIRNFDEHAQKLVDRWVGVSLPFLQILAIDVLQQKPDIGRILLVGIVDQRMGASHARMAHGIRDLMLVHQLLDPAFVLLVFDLHMLEKKDLVVLGAGTPTTTSCTITFVAKGCHAENLLDPDLFVRH